MRHTEAEIPFDRRREFGFDPHPVTEDIFAFPYRGKEEEYTPVLAVDLSVINPTWEGWAGFLYEPDEFCYRYGRMFSDYEWADFQKRSRGWQEELIRFWSYKSWDLPTDAEALDDYYRVLYQLYYRCDYADFLFTNYDSFLAVDMEIYSSDFAGIWEGIEAELRSMGGKYRQWVETQKPRIYWDFFWQFYNGDFAVPDREKLGELYELEHDHIRDLEDRQRKAMSGIRYVELGGSPSWFQGQNKTPGSIPTSSDSCGRITWISEANCFIFSTMPHQAGSWKPTTGTETGGDMTFGPDEILLCPYCRQIFSRNTYASGNTFGSVSWSDGNSLSPMMPQGPPVVRCGNCRSAFFTEDARHVGFVPLGTFMHAPFEIDSFDSMKLEDYREFLAENLHEGDPDRELLLRIKIWQRHNDPLRTDAAEGIPEQPKEFGPNLRRIFELTGASDEPGTALTAAEALRELGRFEQAAALLDKLIEEYRGDPWKDHIAKAAEEIRGEAARKNPDVFRLGRNDEPPLTQDGPAVPPAGGLWDI